MKGSHDARAERLERRLNPEATRNPMSLPIPEEELAFLEGLELWVDRYPNQEDRPLGGPLREAMREACLARGLSVELADGYAEALEQDIKEEHPQVWGDG